MAFTLLAALALPSASCGKASTRQPHAQEQRFVRVIRLTTPDVAGYSALLEEGRHLMAELGVTPTMRLDLEDPGPPATLRLVVEYPSRSIREQWSQRLGASAEFRAWARSLDELRTVLSDSDP